MRPPAPEISSDPFFDLIGQRVAVNVDGNVIKGRPLSCRDSFVTIDLDRGALFTVNKYAMTSIQADVLEMMNVSKRRFPSKTHIMGLDKIETLSLRFTKFTPIKRGTGGVSQ